MKTVGIDTSILVRIANPDDVRHEAAIQILAELRSEGARLVTVPQVFAELWVVATRPTEVNGLGATPSSVDAEITRLLGFFELVAEHTGTFNIWRKLVLDVPIVGRRTHDARLAASYSAIGCDHLLTFNPRDFVSLAGALNLKLVPADALTPEA